MGALLQARFINSERLVLHPAALPRGLFNGFRALGCGWLGAVVCLIANAHAQNQSGPIHPEWNWQQMGQQACVLARQVMQTKLSDYDAFKLITLRGSSQDRQRATLTYFTLLHFTGQAAGQAGASMALSRRLADYRARTLAALRSQQDARALMASALAILNEASAAVESVQGAQAAQTTGFSAARLSQYLASRSRLVDEVYQVFRTAYNGLTGPSMRLGQTFDLSRISMTDEVRHLVSLLLRSQGQGAELTAVGLMDVEETFEQLGTMNGALRNGTPFRDYASRYTRLTPEQIAAAEAKVVALEQEIRRLLSASSGASAAVLNEGERLNSANAARRGATVTRAAEAAVQSAERAESLANAGGRLRQLAAQVGSILGRVEEAVTSTRVGGATVRAGRYIASSTLGRAAGRILFGTEALIATVTYEVGTRLDQALLNGNTIYNERDVSGRITWTAQSLANFTPRPPQDLFENFTIDQICRLVTVRPISDAQSYRGAALVRNAIQGDPVPRGVRLPLAENVVRFSERFIRELPAHRQIRVRVEEHLRALRSEF